MHFLRLFVVVTLCFSFPAFSQAKARPDALEMMDILWDEAEHGTARNVIEDSSEREKVVHHFAKKLERFDDRGLGDVGLVPSDRHADLTAVQESLQKLLDDYQQHVRPVLLNNLKFKRKDYGVKMNKVDLSRLMFPTKYNHKTRKPIAGIFHYKQDIDDSFFGEHWVDAGLLVNFPELEQKAWVQGAITMDAELAAIWRMHRSYTEGVKFGRRYTKKSNEKVNASTVKNSLHEMSVYKREKVVRKFVRSLEKLDDTQPFAVFKQELVKLIATFEITVKPILINNVNARRFDIGARANRGDLISLFYKHKRNYYTGKPISSKLKHGGSSAQDLGYLVVHPEWAEDDVVKAALVMEKSLFQLLEEHESYLKEDKSAMW